jgi:Domain of unknown function (DUF4372)
MHVGKLVFAQLMDQLPWKTFGRIVERYRGDHRVREFSCANQFRCMAFAQLTYRESLRDIATCLRAQSTKLYHLGIRGTVARSTGGRERSARLAHLCGVRSPSDPDRTPALPGREIAIESRYPHRLPALTSFRLAIGSKRSTFRPNIVTQQVERCE